MTKTGGQTGRAAMAGAPLQPCWAWWQQGGEGEGCRAGLAGSGQARANNKATKAPDSCRRRGRLCAVRPMAAGRRWLRRRDTAAARRVESRLASVHRQWARTVDAQWTQQDG